MVRHLQSNGVGIRTKTRFYLGGMTLAVAIVTPLIITPAGRAQQALPPPPTIPNNTELPSLAPITPPTQGIQMPPPVGLPTMPLEPVNQMPLPATGAMPGTGISPQGVMPEIRTSYYQVVVPTQPEYFSLIANKMTSMGVRPDAIQAKKAPIGPHLAVGPFVSLGEAEGVSSYLRSGGMDARVFFNR